MEFEDVYQLIGGCGTFQIGIFTLICLSSLLGVEVIWANFIFYNVDHFCRVDELQNLPRSLQQYIAIPVDSSSSGSSGSYSECSVFSLDYSSYSHDELLHWNRSAFLATDPATRSCHSWVYDHSLFPDSAVEQFDLVCGRAWLRDMVSTLFLAGSAVGTALCGSVGDRFGRQVAFLLSVICKVLGGLLVAFSPNYPTLVVGQFILGTGSIGCYQTALVILMEFVSPEYRTVFGMGCAVAYSCGYMLLSLVAYYVRGYTSFVLAFTLPMAVLLLYPLVIPESPRWLLVRGRKEEAVKILRRIARVNHKKLPPDFNANSIRVASKKNTSDGHSPLDLVRTPRMRTYSLVLFFSWFTCSLIFYALSLGAGNLAGSVFLNNFLLGAVEVPANFICIFMIRRERLGRRLSSVIFFLTAGLACFVCVPLLLDEGLSTAVTVFSLLGKGASTAVFNLLYVYTSEIYPTEVRNLGLGFSNFWARVSGMLASYAGNLLMSVWVPLPSLLFGITGSLAGALSLLLPETLGKELPDTVAQAEQTTPGHVDPERMPLAYESEPVYYGGQHGESIR